MLAGFLLFAGYALTYVVFSRAIEEPTESQKS